MAERWPCPGPGPWPPDDDLFGDEPVDDDDLGEPMVLRRRGDRADRGGRGAGGREMEVPLETSKMNAQTSKGRSGRAGRTRKINRSCGRTLESKAKKVDVNIVPCSQTRKASKKTRQILCYNLT